jgi:tryptophan halogenase
VDTSPLRVSLAPIFDDPTRQALRAQLTQAGLRVVEDEPSDVVLGGTLDDFAAGRAVLSVSARGDVLWAGPLSVPGATACPRCAAAARGESEDVVVSSAVVACTPARAQLLAEFVAMGLAQLGRGGLTTRAVSLGPTGEALFRVLPRPSCAACAAARPAASRLEMAGLAELAAELERESAGGEERYSMGALPHPDRYQSVIILGGGTAGYLTAMALRQRMPELEVTLVESKKIPIISVGEATTADMIKFLHAPHLLGLDIVDFHQRVRPTFKLGIQFLWGTPDTGRFHYPFQYSPLLEPYLYDGDTDTQSVASQLMALDRCPLYQGADGELFSLLEVVRFAYHLDNERLVHFLAEESVRRGTRYVDAVVARAVTSADGQTVDHLVTDDGRQLRADLYVDASGFRSVLLEGALGSPFQSFASSLYTDRAWAVSTPNHGHVRPYTQARTMSAGWRWNIPFEDGDHLGYVYSSQFQSEDAALHELRTLHPEMGEPRLIKFRSGRHQHFFKGNVVALGNAYGFVEPLESTALHLLVYEIEHLLNHFPLKTDEATKAALDTKMGSLWDQLRWFLAIHYRFNRRVDSPFWRAAAQVDISGLEEKLAVFRERAPMSDRPSLYYSVFAPDFFSGDHALDTLLLGQKVEARLGPPRMSREEHAQRATLRQKVASRALSQAAGLPALRARPDLLRRFVESPSSWVHNWVQR